MFGVVLFVGLSQYDRTRSRNCFSPFSIFSSSSRLVIGQNFWLTANSQISPQSIFLREALFRSLLLQSGSLSNKARSLMVTTLPSEQEGMLVFKITAPLSFMKNVHSSLSICHVDFTCLNCFGRTHFASAVEHELVPLSIFWNSECFSRAFVVSILS